ncbi:catalase family peroxidase [Lysobacter pythonis]|uniref:Catalase-related peroxidase n=1 Tax=Solilutibacter pythonis TaxID=2483112 RepID=A0A3M2I3H1_9GAMM|nr:catalase family peroxidase [Lysobacter pythonis]RMH94139.1 catalase family peroxidase [Lysobacter pythonis]
MSSQLLSELRRRPWLAASAIGAVVLAAASAFAWSAGWIGARERLTSQRLIEAVEVGNGRPYPGFRRAHAKGLCVGGWFEPSEAAAAYSRARVFSQARVPVVGRMSIGGGNPYGADDSARVRSMALQLQSDDGQQWRMAMNSFPFMSVSTPEAFRDQALAMRADPATGKPDPARQAAVAARYPSIRAFQAWAKSAPWPTSWANTRYNGVNTFLFQDARGGEHAVRWSMRPHAAFAAMDEAGRKAAGADFLAAEFQQRLRQGPQRWDLVLTFAAPGDVLEDPARAWPEHARREIVAGTLALETATSQQDGACRDINFDPLILPEGIRGSNDPILHARSGAYSRSFNLRERETALGRKAEGGKEVDR